MPARPRSNPDRCKNDHDLSVPRNRYVVVRNGRARVECRVCRRLVVYRLRSGAHHCAQCGAEKYPDRRLLCFTCSFEKKRGTSPSDAVDRLTDALALECAPAWVRRGTDEEKRRWLRENRTPNHRAFR